MLQVPQSRSGTELARGGALDQQSARNASSSDRVGIESVLVLRGGVGVESAGDLVRDRDRDEHRRGRVVRGRAAAETSLPEPSRRESRAPRESASVFRERTTRRTEIPPPRGLPEGRSPATRRRRRAARAPRRARRIPGTGREAAGGSGPGWTPSRGRAPLRSSRPASPREICPSSTRSSVGTIPVIFCSNLGANPLQRPSDSRRRRSIPRAGPRSAPRGAVRFPTRSTGAVPRDRGTGAIIRPAAAAAGL